MPGNKELSTLTWNHAYGFDRWWSAYRGMSMRCSSVSCIVNESWLTGTSRNTQDPQTNQRSPPFRVHVSPHPGRRILPTTAPPYSLARLPCRGRGTSLHVPACNAVKSCNAVCAEGSAAVLQEGCHAGCRCGEQQARASHLSVLYVACFR